MEFLSFDVSTYLNNSVELVTLFDWAGTDAIGTEFLGKDTFTLRGCIRKNKERQLNNKVGRCVTLD